MSKLKLTKKQIKTLELVFNSAIDSLENVYGYATISGDDGMTSVLTAEKILKDIHELGEILKQNIEVIKWTL